MKNKIKLISWNVNGIRAVYKKNFLGWLAEESPDILCVQETKASPGQLPAELVNPPGYKSVWSSAEKKGYSGVVTYIKTPYKTSKSAFGIRRFDIEGRMVLVEYDAFILFNVYFPNGKKDSGRLKYKMDFYEDFLKHIDSHKSAGKNIIICGDFNTAHKEIDLSHPKDNVGISGFLPQERAWLDKLVSHGYIDTFRKLCDKPLNYTWWDYKTGARERNIGWRLDYFFISESLLKYLNNSYILKDVPGSDHCPVAIELNNITL